MRKIDPVATYRDRHARRARALAERFDRLDRFDQGNHEGNDDDEVVLRPWELRLPRTVLLAAARSRGLELVGGTDALVQRGPWLEPLRFRRPAAAEER